MWLALACGTPVAERIEGTEPGDCADGADNDADGTFDCDDAGCAGAPDCVEESGGDSAGDGDTGDTGDTGDHGETGETDDSEESGDSDETGDPGESGDSGETADTGAGGDCDVATDGSAPFRTIQDAVDAASDGDTVVVCPGEYARFEATVVDLTVVGRDGAESTVVNGGTEPAVTATGVSLALQGLTFTSAPPTNGVAGVRATSAEVTVTDCWLIGAEAQSSAYSTQGFLASGGTLVLEGVLIEGNALQHLVYTRDGGNLEVRHTIIRENEVPSYGSGGIAVGHFGCDAEFANNLVVSNAMYFSAELLVFSPASTACSAWAHNNTIWGNRNNYTGSGTLSCWTACEAVNNVLSDNVGGGIYEAAGGVVTYNDVWGGSGTAYTTADGTLDGSNLTVDPHLVDPEGGDFTLDPGFSPCIDAGDPRSGYNDADGTRNDMGAFGGPNGSWP